MRPPTDKRARNERWSVKASELLTRQPVTIGPGETVATAISRMERANIRHLPVLDQGTVIGMLSDRDILVGRGGSATPGTRRHLDMCVDEIMSQPVRTIRSDVDLDQIVELMIMHRISCLPVVDDGELAGIITKTDLMRWYLDFCEKNPTLTAATYTVRHCMQPNVMTVQPADSASVAIQKMVAAAVQHVPVVEGHQLVGIISDRDVRRSLGVSTTGINRLDYEPSQNELSTRVNEIMTANPTTIDPDARMSKAADLMLANRFSALLVLSDRTLAGIVTETDIMRLVRSLVMTTVA